MLGKTLTEWTGLSGAEIIYDSDVCPFTQDDLFDAVRSKENIAIVATTTEGDVFGAFYTVAVDKRDEWFHDPDMFLFSFGSHGRCETPMRFDVKKRCLDVTRLKFYQNDFDGWFVGFYCGWDGFDLGNEKSRTWAENLSKSFKRIEGTTLSGDERNIMSYHCARLIALWLF